MALDLRSHPKWLAAIAREREIRESGYLGIATSIADGAISLTPLTLRQLTTLIAARNPVACGGGCSDADAVAFLWAVHPAYAPNNLVGREGYFAELRELDLPWDQIINELRAFYADQMLDAPKPSRARPSTEHAPAVSGPSIYISDLWANGCPLSREQILDSPVICLNQERRCFLMRQPKHGVTGGTISNAVEREIVVERRAARAETASVAVIPSLHEEKQNDGQNNQPCDPERTTLSFPAIRADVRLVGNLLAAVCAFYQRHFPKMARSCAVSKHQKRGHQ